MSEKLSWAERCGDCSRAFQRQLRAKIPASRPRSYDMPPRCTQRLKPRGRSLDVAAIQRAVSKRRPGSGRSLTWFIRPRHGSSARRAAAQDQPRFAPGRFRGRKYLGEAPLGEILRALEMLEFIGSS